ncbi:NAD(+) synthase [Candidatus Harpocratesius sp.]
MNNYRNTFRILPDKNLSREPKIIDPKLVSGKIEDLIKFVYHRLNRDGAIIGVSGGLDSAVTASLTVRALGKETVLGINLPEFDSKPIHQKHAKRFAQILGIQFKRINITRMVRAAGTYRILPLRFLPTRYLRNRAVDYGKRHFLNNHGDHLLQNRLESPKNKWIAKGNAYAISKHRLRMVKLYQLAELGNLMVVGAANRTEWLTGTFSKWGVDHCADVMPIMHLYRTQVEQLAEYLEIPDWIRNKYADPDVIPSILDKESLLGGFQKVDEILMTVEDYFTMKDQNNQSDQNIRKILNEIKSEQKNDTKNRKKLSHYQFNFHPSFIEFKKGLYEKFNRDLVDSTLALVEKSAHMRVSPFHL